MAQIEHGGSREKIKVSLSVSQLAYLFRVLSEVGAIKNKNVSEVLRFVCDNFSTPKAESISFDSLRMKYYNPEASAKQAIKDLAIKQINFVQREGRNQ